MEFDKIDRINEYLEITTWGSANFDENMLEIVHRLFGK